MSTAALIVDAIAALEGAASRLEELDRPEAAHRCANVADRLHIEFLADLERVDPAEQEDKAWDS